MYGLLIVCQASRALHIEVLDDMNTYCFMNGVGCLMTIRGSVSRIICDQGSNLIGAAHELKRAFHEIKCGKGKDVLLKHRCEFIFNSQYSSHMGGTFKRHARTVRNILNNMLYKHGNQLDTASPRTLMYEVMSLVNSRPLTYTYLHDGELDPLTPNHLIIMKAIVTPPPGYFVSEDVYASKR